MITRTHWTADTNTKLATYVWDKRDEGVEIKEVKWEILKKCQKYEPGGRKCDVCLSEKLIIMKDRDPSVDGLTTSE